MSDVTTYACESDFLLLQGDVLDALQTIPDGVVHMCVTSPPYFGLRDYGTGTWEGGDPDCDHRQQLGGEGATSTKQNSSAGTQTLAYRDACGKCGATRTDQQLGLEATPEEYVARMLEVFREVHRVLRSDGTCWLNLGDSYASGQVGRDDAERKFPSLHKEQEVSAPRRQTRKTLIRSKNLVGIPWRVAFALQADGWILRSDIIWEKPNVMPESVRDRPTKSHEHIFLLAKQSRYYFDQESVREPYTSVDNRKVTTVKGKEGSIQHRDGERWPGSGRNIRDVWKIPTKGFSAVREGLSGTIYTRSADCPKHGLAADPESWRRAAHDEPPADTRFRISGNDARLALGLVVGSASSSPHIQSHPPSEALQTPRSRGGSKMHGVLNCGDGLADGAGRGGRSCHNEDQYAPVTDSSGSFPPGRSLAASPHSSRSHRRGHALETSSACTLSAQTPSGTVDTSAPHVLFEHNLGSVENRTEGGSGEGEMGSGPSVETQSCMTRKCTCQKHHTVDHFASFPEELVRRCIFAGSSEKGCCPECGAPWTRVVEKKSVVGAERGAQPSQSRANLQGPQQSSVHSLTRTTGWVPGCECGYADAAPAVVLDPFMGSGTTALVSRQHGRRSIGIELNPDYCEMAINRIATVEPTREITTPVFAQFRTAPGVA